MIETSNQFEVSISPTAMEMIGNAFEQNPQAAFLRLYMTLNGYGMALDSKLLDTDLSTIFDNGQVKLSVVTDELSTDLVDGCIIDYQQSDDAEGRSGFIITNPNVTPYDAAACGGCTGDAGCC